MPAYEMLTFPYYRHLLRSDDDDLLAVGASCFGQPAGLAVARTNTGERFVAEVLSLAVGLPYRRQGIGFQLLERLQTELTASGCKAMFGLHMSNRPSSAALEALLQKHGWETPERRMMICESDFDTITKAPWMARREFPPEFEVFQWTTLSAAERQWLLENNDWYPELLTPFYYEERIEPVSSLGLRYQGQIAGWCITHRVDRETIRFVRLFVRKELQSLGRSIMLLAQSIYRHEYTEVYKAIFDVAIHNPAMIRFVETRMAPYMQSICWTQRSKKIFARAA